MGVDRGKHSRIFITRSPCIGAGDGKLLPVVTTKPCSMPMQDWKWLNNLGFGVVIFGAPQSKDTTPLPETITAGDLDGNQYSVCWDSSILSHLQHIHVKKIRSSNRDEEPCKKWSRMSNANLKLLT